MWTLQVKNKRGRSGFRDCYNKKTLNPWRKHHRTTESDRSAKLSSKRNDLLDCLDSIIYAGWSSEIHTKYRHI